MKTSAILLVFSTLSLMPFGVSADDEPHPLVESGVSCETARCKEHPRVDELVNAEKSFDELTAKMNSKKTEKIDDYKKNYLPKDPAITAPTEEEMEAKKFKAVGENINADRSARKRADDLKAQTNPVAGGGLPLGRFRIKKKHKGAAATYDGQF